MSIWPLPFVLRLLLLMSALCAQPLAAFGTESSAVRVVCKDGVYQILRNGEPYFIKGAGGRDRLEELVKAGGNSIRTWHARDLSDLLNRAAEAGLTVTVGLWLPHERHQFDYSDDAAVDNVVNRALETVKTYRDHPAVLMWGIGNEVEGDGSNPKVWQTVNDIARKIKVLDPNHPTMTVVAGTSHGKIRRFVTQCPDVDVLGVNAYGDLGRLPEKLKRQGLNRPYVVTEFGPFGWWQVDKTPWGAELEPTSTQKAETYLAGYRAAVLGEPDLCLGAYAFLWGDKQEHTRTWFGMFLPEGQRTGSVDVMTLMWTGDWPSNRSPVLRSLAVRGAAGETATQQPSQHVYPPRAKLECRVEAHDPDGDSLTVRWELRSESTDKKTGGDREEPPPAHPEAVIASDGVTAVIETPEQAGAYRVFVYVLDDKGNAATANVPILVK
jgi:hypothetical protein